MGPDGDWNAPGAPAGAGAGSGPRPKRFGGLGRRRTLALGGLAAGLVALIVGVVIVTHDDGSPNVVRAGATSVVPSTSTTAATRLTTTVPPTTLPPTSAPVPPVAIGAGQLGLPSLGIEAPITEVRVRPNGELEVPPYPLTVGWWADGAKPGSGKGSVVIDGHVDSSKYGRGAFFHLRDLKAGDPVWIAAKGDTRRQYRVTANMEFPKNQLPSNEVFNQQVGERLVLVTCGGEFNRSTRHYADNIVVYAEPV